MNSTCFAHLQHAGIGTVHLIGPPLQADCPGIRMQKTSMPSTERRRPLLSKVLADNGHDRESMITLRKLSFDLLIHQEPAPHRHSDVMQEQHIASSRIVCACC